MIYTFYTIVSPTILSLVTGSITDNSLNEYIVNYTEQDVERKPGGAIISNEISASVDDNVQYSTVNVAVIKSAYHREGINKIFDTEIRELS